MYLKDKLKEKWYGLSEKQKNYIQCGALGASVVAATAFSYKALENLDKLLYFRDIVDSNVLNRCTTFMDGKIVFDHKWLLEGFNELRYVLGFNDPIKYIHMGDGQIVEEVALRSSELGDFLPTINPSVYSKYGLMVSGNWPEAYGRAFKAGFGSLGNALQDGACSLLSGGIAYKIWSKIKK